MVGFVDKVGSISININLSNAFITIKTPDLIRKYVSTLSNAKKNVAKF